MERFKIRKSTLTLILSFILFVLMGVAAVFGKNGFLTVQQLERELSEINSNILELSIENKRLIGDIDTLRHDKISIETLARKRLGLVFPQDRVYKIVQNDQQDSLYSIDLN